MDSVSLFFALVALLLYLVTKSGNFLNEALFVMAAWDLFLVMRGEGVKIKWEKVYVKQIDTVTMIYVYWISGSSFLGGRKLGFFLT